MMKPAFVFVLPLLLAGPIGCGVSPPPGDVESASEAEPAPQSAEEPTTPAEELAQIRSRLEAVKAELFDEERYNCCVQPACDWCALHEGACECFSNLQSGDAVCPGCGLGWHNGQGIVEGVDADDVQWNITHEHPAAGGHAH